MNIKKIIIALFLLGTAAVQAGDKLNIGYIAEPAHGLHFIARDKGYFAQENIDAELFQFSTTAEGLSALSAKKLNVGTFGTAAPLLFIARGSDYTIIGGMMIDGQAIITLPENADKFKDLKSFKGKKIGLGKLTTGDVIFRGALKKAGIDPAKDMTFVELPGQSAVVEAVRKGAVDAGIVFSPHFALAEKNYGLKVSNYVADFYPRYTCCRLTVNTADLKNNRDTYKHFLIALIRAYKFYRENPDETVEIFARGLKIDPEIIRNDTYTNPTFESNPDPLKKGTLDFWHVMQDIGYLPPNNVDLEQHIDTTVYREALDEVLKRYPNDPTYLELDKFFKANN